MTKAKLLELLAPYSDDTEIFVSGQDTVFAEDFEPRILEANINEDRTIYPVGFDREDYDLGLISDPKDEEDEAINADREAFYQSIVTYPVVGVLILR